MDRHPVHSVRFGRTRLAITDVLGYSRTHETLIGVGDQPAGYGKIQNPPERAPAGRLLILNFCRIRTPIVQKCQLGS